MIVGASSGWLHMLVWLGLFGLVASFHGIIMGYSRQIFALSREAYLPAYFAKVHPRFKTPHRAILAGGVIGIAAIFSDEWIQIGGLPLTANIVTMAVFWRDSDVHHQHVKPVQIAPHRTLNDPPVPGSDLPLLSCVCIDCRICLLGHHDLLQPLDLWHLRVIHVGWRYIYFRMTVHNRASRTN